VGRLGLGRLGPGLLAVLAAQYGFAVECVRAAQDGDGEGVRDDAFGMVLVCFWYGFGRQNHTKSIPRAY